MSRIVKPDGSDAIPERPPKPEDILKAMATKLTMDKLEQLRRSVSLPKDPTPEQTAYAENVRGTLKNVAMDFYFLGVRDFKIRQAAEIRNQKLNRAAMSAIQDGKNGRKPKGA